MLWPKKPKKNKKETSQKQKLINFFGWPEVFEIYLLSWVEIVEMPGDN